MNTNNSEPLRLITINKQRHGSQLNSSNECNRIVTIGKTCLVLQLDSIRRRVLAFFALHLWQALLIISDCPPDMLSPGELRPAN